MINDELAGFYERDLRKLIEEINLFKNEENLWKTAGTIKNSCGNLALHLIGGLNFLIGTTLAKTGYVRNRDLEFSKKGVDRKELINELEKLILLINQTIHSLTEKEIETDFPIFFDKPHASTRYVLMQLSLHLNYHLGQMNYLRRILE